MKEYPVITRFNPTTNGLLHVGHLYLILVNEWESHNSKFGGKFIVRFDDNQAYWREKMGKEGTERITAGIKDDLEWLGIEVDQYVSQLEIESTTYDELDRYMERIKHPVLRGMYYHDRVPMTKSTFTYYPYTPYYTLEKVWLDFQEKVSTLIRGIDLVTEYAFYEYVVDALALPKVQHIYLPRLRQESGELANLSKTEGNWKIGELKELGFTPQEIKHHLAMSCLANPSGEWSVDNVLPNPVISE